MMFTFLTEASLLAYRESADGARLAVKVEDKFVKIRNVKVSLFFLSLSIFQLLYTILRLYMCYFVLGVGKLGAVRRWYL